MIHYYTYAELLTNREVQVYETKLNVSFNTYKRLSQLN